MARPSSSGMPPPTRPVLPPWGTMGTRASAQSRTTPAASSVCCRLDHRQRARPVALAPVEQVGRHGLGLDDQPLGTDQSFEAGDQFGRGICFGGLRFGHGLNLKRRTGHGQAGGLAVPRRGGAAQAVVDRSTQAGIRDRHHRDCGKFGPVEFVERGEQPGRGFGGIAGFAQVDGRGRARERRRSESEQGLFGVRPRSRRGAAGAPARSGCSTCRET